MKTFLGWMKNATAKVMVWSRNINGIHVNSVISCHNVKSVYYFFKLLSSYIFVHNYTDYQQCLYRNLYKWQIIGYPSDITTPFVEIAIFFKRGVGGIFQKM